MTLRGRITGGGRPLAAAALGVAFSAVYIGLVYVVVVLGGVAVTSGDGRSTALTIAAAALVAVTFGSVRKRAHRSANRLVLGTRATPLETLHQFSQGVAAAYGADDVLAGMARALAEGTGARRAEVWLVVGPDLRRSAVWPPEGRERVGAADRPAAHWPDERVDVDLCVPVRLDQELLGVLALAERPGRSFTAAEEALVTDLASHAGLVLQNVRLSTELAGRRDHLVAQAEALQESRRRLVAARTAERRRVERNIHDGAQQHLVALLVRIGLVPVLVETDEEKAAAELTGLGPLCDDALATLADLAHGLHPSELTEKGLAASLSAATARVPGATETSLEATGLRRYAADIEAAAYFACLEAVQNAVKYSACTSIAVRLAEVDGLLTFSVTDDGAGFDTSEVSLGAGLTNMVDRIEAMNGNLSVSSTPGEGTTVDGRLPLVDPARSTSTRSVASAS